MDELKERRKAEKTRKQNWRTRIFHSKSPLLGALAGSLILSPCGACASIGGMNQENAARVIPITAVKETIRSNIDKLGNKDLKIAFNAARSLIRAGRKAVPELLKVLDDNKPDKAELFKRSLAVLYAIKWEKIPDKEKKDTLEKVFPILFTFGPKGRETESLIAEGIMLKIGALSLPAYAALIKSPLPVARAIGISALAEIDWAKMPYQAVEGSGITDALSKMKEDPIEAFREVSQMILKKIRLTFVVCQKEDMMNKTDGRYGGENEGWKKAA